MGSESAAQAGGDRERGVPGTTSGAFLQDTNLPQKRGKCLESSE